MGQPRGDGEAGVVAVAQAPAGAPDGGDRGARVVRGEVQRGRGAGQRGAGGVAALALAGWTLYRIDHSKPS